MSQSDPKVVLTGGGSGGHIMPVLAVAAALKKADASVKTVYIGQTGEALSSLITDNPNIDENYSVRAGKFRRYHGLGIRQLFDLKTAALNIRDIMYIVIGLIQSYRILGNIKPDVIFTRGGYVSVPVALAGAIRRTPFITHDSDSTPSLANRLIARWAWLHAVALPPASSHYPYPKHKTEVVGVPIGQLYQPVTKQLLAVYQKQLGIKPSAKVLLITGGGNGADKLNQIAIANSRTLLRHNPELQIVHSAGAKHAETTMAAYAKLLEPELRKRVAVYDFLKDMHRYSAVATVIIARGGATNLAEFAAQSKACVIVPSPHLIWNVKNTELLAKQRAVLSLTEDQADQEGRLANIVQQLLDDPQACKALGAALHNTLVQDAASKLANILLKKANVQQDKS